MSVAGTETAELPGTDSGARSGQQEGLSIARPTGHRTADKPSLPGIINDNTESLREARGPLADGALLETGTYIGKTM